MRSALTGLIVVVALSGASCDGTHDGDAGGEASVQTTSTPGLRCPEDVTEHAIYDYGDSPPPDGGEPVEAVEAFFGDGLPADVHLEVSGPDVHVILGAVTVAIIGLLPVPDGYVVESYDACQDTISAP